MRCLKKCAQVILLSMLAGTACTASEPVQKVKIMKDAVSSQPLQAGISLTAADGSSAAVESPMVVFHVSNVSDEAVNMLKWNTPLETELSADVFEVRRDGQPVEYLGRMVKRGTPAEGDFISIPPGGRVNVIIDLARYYDMSEPGHYSVSYKPDLIDGVVQLNQQTPVTMEAQTLILVVGD